MLDADKPDEAPARDYSDPAGRQDSPARSGAVSASEKVFPAGQRLVKEALLLERLAEDDAQHDAITCVGELLDARPPPVDEGLRRITIFTDHVACASAAFPAGLSSGCGTSWTEPPRSVIASRIQFNCTSSRLMTY